MKKILSIIFISLLLSGNSYAEQSLIKIIDIYWKRGGEIKANKVDTYTHLFLQEELKIATDEIARAGRPCYREVLKNKNNYDSNADCLKFRVLLGNDNDEWTENLGKIMAIFKVHNDLANNTDWIEKWDDKDFSKFTNLGMETVKNISIASELVILITD